VYLSFGNERINPTVPSFSRRIRRILAVVVFGVGSLLAGCTAQTADAKDSSDATAEGQAQGSTITIPTCAEIPSACGYPDETNSGVLQTDRLIDVPGDVTSGTGWEVDPRGWISVNKDGAVIDGITTTLSIDVSANNAIISNSRITVSGDTWAIVTRDTTDVTIQNNEISSPVAEGPQRLLVGIKDINGGSSGLKVVGNNIFHTATGVQIDSGLIEDNYIHDLGFNEGDHVNGTTSNAGIVPLTIRHNTVLNPLSQTDAISLFQDFGPQANRLIEDNLIAGGSYTLYAGANEGKEATATNIRVVNNRFSQIYFPKGGDFGPGNAYAPSSGNEWSGNVWDHDESEVPPP
jgi:hypothetical protein